MAIYGTGYGPGLAPWWQGSSDQFTGQQQALGRGPSELDVRKVLDAISNQRDFSNMGGGMFSLPQQGVPVATTPVGQPVPIAAAPMQPAVMPSVQPVTNNVAPQVTQMNSNMGAPMTSSVMPPPNGAPMTSAVMPPASGAPMTSSVMPPSQPAGVNVSQAQPAPLTSQVQAPQAAPMAQENILNQNFMQLLQGLGLNNLFQSFQPQSVQPNQMNMFGPAPLFSNSGLFNSIY